MRFFWKIPPLVNRLNASGCTDNGAFPAIALNDAVDRDLFYSSYVQTYLQRDVRDLARVGDEMAFLRFLRAAAAPTELACDADVAPNAAKNWLSIVSKCQAPLLSLTGLAL